MVVISASDNENVQGVCVHSKNIYFDFEYKSIYDPGLNYTNWRDDLLISFYAIESIACKPKSDDFYLNAKANDVRSTAKNNNYKNVVFTTKSQNAGPVTIRQSAEWYVERICDTCCKEYKQKDLSLINQTIIDGRGGGGNGPSSQNPLPLEYSNGYNLQTYLSNAPYMSFGYQRIVQSHPILFRKIMNMIKEQSDQFNRSGYLSGRNSKENLSNSLTEKSKEIDNDLINSLGCAGAAVTCLACDNHPPTQYDPTYKTENDVILELNYGNTIVTNYGPQADLIKLVDLKFNKNSSWVDNI